MTGVPGHLGADVGYTPPGLPTHQVGGEPRRRGHRDGSVKVGDGIPGCRGLG